METGERSMIYLACPYTHSSPVTRKAQYHRANRATVWLIQQRDEQVFSPISHGHGIHQASDCSIPHDYWMALDLNILSYCTKVVVLCVYGWDESLGVDLEITHAKKLNIPVHYLVPGKDGYEIQHEAPANGSVGRNPHSRKSYTGCVGG
jgi:hypothetical protein